MPIHRSIPRPLIGFSEIDNLSIAEIGFLAKLETISSITHRDTGQSFYVPLTMQQIATHCGIHENTAKKLRASLVQKGVLTVSPATHENGARIGNYYDSPITFTL